MIETNKKLSAADYTPVITFVISFFVFQLFDWPHATYFTLATLVSLITFMIEVHILKEDYEVKTENIKKLSFYTGLLTLFFLAIFASAFLHWYRIISIGSRTILLLFIVVVYLVLLFRAIRILSEINEKSNKKK